MAIATGGRLDSTFVTLIVVVIELSFSGEHPLTVNLNVRVAPVGPTLGASKNVFTCNPVGLSYS